MAETEFSLENIVRVTLEAKEIAAQELEKEIDEARAGAERAILAAAQRGLAQAVVCEVRSLTPKDPVTMAVDGWLRAKGFRTVITPNATGGFLPTVLMASWTLPEIDLAAG